MQNWTRWAAVGLSVMTVGGLAACGSSSDDESASGNASATGSGTTAATPKFTGPPIKIMNSAPINAAAYAYPQIPKMVQAGVDGINRRGGINGSKVELSVCDNGNDPNKAAQCAQQAVKEGAVALVGAYGLTGDTGFYPVLEAAKIPSIGPGASVPDDWTSKNAFPIAYSPQAYVAGPPVAMAAAGCKSITLTGFDDAAYDIYFGFGEAGIKYANVKYAGAARFGSSTTDFTPVVQKAIGQGSDCIMTLGPDAATAGLLRAIKGSGKDIRLGGLTHISDNIPELGAALDGSPFAAPSPQPNPDAGPDAPPLMKQFAEDMQAAGYTDPKNMALTAFGMYLSVPFFEQVAKTIPAGKVTKETLFAALNQAKFDGGGVVGASDFTQPSPVTSTPRLSNYTMFEFEVENEQWKPLDDGKPLDLTNLFKGMSG